MTCCGMFASPPTLCSSPQGKLPQTNASSQSTARPFSLVIGVCNCFTIEVLHEHRAGDDQGDDELARTLLHFASSAHRTGSKMAEKRDHARRGRRSEA